MPGGRGRRSEGAQDAAAQALHAGRTGQGDEGRRQAGVRPAPEGRSSRTRTGIGTEATRANIISGLLTRGYLVKKGRAIRASDAAFTLIDAVPAAIADPGHHGRLGTGAGHDRSRDSSRWTFIDKQSAWISQLIAAVPAARSLSIKICPKDQPCPAVRRTDAPAHRQERPVFWSCSRYPDCKGTLPVESGTSKRGCLAPRAVPVQRPQRLLNDPVPREPCPPSAARPCVPHAPAGRPARNAFLSACASRLGHPRPRDLKVASPRTVSRAFC
jgi:hypothetical protein